MQQFSDLAKSWSDTLTVLSVGSLSFFIPIVTKVDADGTLSFALKKVVDFFQFTEDSGTAAALVMSVIFLGILMMLGSIVVQFGEFIALLPDLKNGRNRAKRRVDESSTNTVLLLIFSNAYTSYRLMCGIGGLLLCSGLILLIRGLISLNIQTIFSAVAILNVGVPLLIFARFSFTTLDWIIFGDFKN